MKDNKRIFTTDSVDDSYFMSSDLHVNETFKNGLEFHLDGQKDNTHFTLYRQGIEDLSDFLVKWLNENK